MTTTRWRACVALLAMTAVDASDTSQPTAGYVSPFATCSSLPPGDYCDPYFPRGLIHCPSVTQSVCAAGQKCQVGDSLGQVRCVPDLSNPVTELCLNKAPGTSYCYHNMTVECDTGDVFLCPSDLVCQRRGRRAYCIQPAFIPEPTMGFCNGVQESSDEANPATICHPVNLKKVITCPAEQISFCGVGHMCDSSGDSSHACCIPYQNNTARFCSNKPLGTSFCLPQTEGQFILCSNAPMVAQCPSGKCVQDRSITAKCV